MSDDVFDASIEIKGTITRTVAGRRVVIDFVVDEESGSQWGQPNGVLSENCDLMDALEQAVRAEIDDV